MNDSVAVAAVVGLGIAFFLVKSRWNYIRLPKLPAPADAAAPDVTIIIPARNEEKWIGRSAGSFPGFPVIVVDDASEDRTAEIARTAGATVIPAPPLHKGTLGKPNACLAGARHAHTRWLLFADADTRYQPEFVPAFLDYARAEDLVSASAFLKQERVTLFERMLMPYAFALYFCGVNARRVNDPKCPQALANGQCLLFRRDAYEYVGGHKAVASSVIEDMALARIVKRHRMRSRVVRAEHLGSVRMYDGFRSIWRGFQKNSFRFLLVNPLSGVQVILASILLTSYAPVLAWLILDGEYPAAAGFALLPGIVLSPWYGSPSAIFYAPFAIYFFQLIALNGMASTLFGRKAVWKGRRV